MVCRCTVEYLSFFENIDRDKNKKIYKAFNALNHFLVAAWNRIPENYFILYARPEKNYLNLQYILQQSVQIQRM